MLKRKGIDSMVSLLLKPMILSREISYGPLKTKECNCLKGKKCVHIHLPRKEKEFDLMTVNTKTTPNLNGHKSNKPLLHTQTTPSKRKPMVNTQLHLKPYRINLVI